ncbi:unnamed protein product, partial [Musa hybrid cultivar]
MSSWEHVGPTDDPCFRRSPPSVSMESSIPFGGGRGGSVRDEGALHQLHDEGFSLVLLPPTGLCHRRRSSSLGPRTLLV